jgi:ribonuclease BN (tRNA processing enzyme)
MMAEGNSILLTLLGTGTPAPRAHRAGSSYLVAGEEQRMLVDCGPGCVQRLLQKGVPLTSISRLFLTHLHYDHCVDLAQLVLVRWDQGAGRIPELEIIGPTGTRRMVDLLFGEAGVFGPDLAARTRHPASQEVYEMRGGQLPRHRPAPQVREIADVDLVRDERWTVRAAQVVHCEPQLTTLAYRLEMAGRALTFSADTSPTPRLTELARGSDVLVHMCHFLNRPGNDPRETASCSGHLDAARTARDAGVRKLVLVHITPPLEAPDVRRQLLKEAGEIFQGDILFGEDLLDIPVT